MGPGPPVSWGFKWHAELMTHRAEQATLLRGLVDAACGLPASPPSPPDAGGHRSPDGPAASHLDAVEILELPDPIAGREERLASGMQWVDLRMCQERGHIGGCETRPAATRLCTTARSGHPIIRSAEPREDWSWCYEDELMFRLKPS